MSTIIKRGLTTAAATPKMATSPKIICIGRNYAAHAAELNNPQPKAPFFFLKPASSILLPNSGPVLRPRGVDLHYEVELALIIGRPLHDLHPTDTAGALDAIAAYAVGIDMTARNMQDDAKRAGLPWSMAKGFDTFLPLSGVIPKSRLPDPHRAELWLDVNGEKRQVDSTGLMVFRIPRILADISRVMRLEVGDVVLTGTPKGVGSVVPGDVMTAGIRVDGVEVEEGRIEVGVEEAQGLFVYGGGQ